MAVHVLTKSRTMPTPLSGGHTVVMPQLRGAPAATRLSEFMHSMLCELAGDSISLIPEPSTVMLIGLASFGLAARRRR